MIAKRTVPAKQTPGPKGSLLLGNLKHYRADPLQFLLRSAIEAPELVRFRMAYVPLFLVVKPEYIRHVLQDNAKNYVKGISYDSLKLMLGNGLLVSEGELWRRQRRLMQPAFLRQHLARKLHTISAAVEAVVERWRALPPEPFDVVPEMLRLAFDIVGRTVLGIDLSEELDGAHGAFTRGSAFVYDRMQQAMRWPMALPLPSHRQFKLDRRRLDALVARVIARHREVPQQDASAFISLLMAARDEKTGEGMSDQQLRDEVITLLGAGHETTGDALSWIWWMLGQHPEVEARLHAELDQVLAGRPPGGDDLPKLTYASSVIDEVMRIYPPAWAFTRSAVADDSIDGHPVPKGAVVVVSPYVNHHHPQLWSEPERFDPDRFAPAAAVPPAYSYFPFGGGSHMCIGKHLSLIELQLALTRLAQVFRVVPEPHQTVKPDPSIALHPTPGLRVRLAPR